MKLKFKMQKNLIHTQNGGSIASATPKVEMHQHQSLTEDHNRTTVNMTIPVDTTVVKVELDDNAEMDKATMDGSPSIPLSLALSSANGKDSPVPSDVITITTAATESAMTDNLNARIRQEYIEDVEDDFDPPSAPLSNDCGRLADMSPNSNVPLVERQETESEVVVKFVERREPPTSTMGISHQMNGQQQVRVIRDGRYYEEPSTCSGVNGNYSQTHNNGISQKMVQHTPALLALNGKQDLRITSISTHNNNGGCRASSTINAKQQHAGFNNNHNNINNNNVVNVITITNGVSSVDNVKLKQQLGENDTQIFRAPMVTSSTSSQLQPHTNMDNGAVVVTVESSSNRSSNSVNGGSGCVTNTSNSTSANSNCAMRPPAAPRPHQHHSSTMNGSSLNGSNGLTPKQKPSTASSSTANEEPSSSIPDLEFDGTTVLCRVCGDKASGFHYGVHSCEGCKGFFRRSIQQKIQYRPCTKNQQCSILRINRNRCQYCRLKKCIAVGMSRDAVRFGRVPKREKARILAAMQQSTQNRGQQRALATELDDQPRLLAAVLRAHMETCEFTREKVAAMRQRARDCPSYSMPTLACPLNPAPELQSEQEFSQRFAHVIRGVIDFAGMIPGFQLLTQDDKFTLLKAGLFDALFVRLICMFDSSINSIICLNGQVMRRDAIQNGANARFLVDSTFNFAERMNSMQLTDAEIGLFCAIVLITPDRPGLRNIELIDKMYAKLKGCLHTVIMQNRPDQPEFLNDLLKTMPDLRTLSTLHTEKLVVFRTEHKELLRQQMWSMDDDASSKSPGSSSWGCDNSSLEDVAKSPMGSVSSTESGDTLGSNEYHSHHHQHHNNHHHHLHPHSHHHQMHQHHQATAASTTTTTSSSSSTSSAAASAASSAYQNSASAAASSSAPLLAATLAAGSVAAVAAAAAAAAASSGSSTSSSTCPITSTAMLRHRANSGSSVEEDLVGPAAAAALSQNGLTITPVVRQMPSNTHHQNHHHQMMVGNATNGHPVAGQQQQQQQQHIRYRKLDSPTDSGIESGNEKQDHKMTISSLANCSSSSCSSGSSSCSSPRSTVEEQSMAVPMQVDNHHNHHHHHQQQQQSGGKKFIVEDMPVLKRVLQAPPLYDTNSLMDEAYKPHKKFRAMRSSSVSSHKDGVMMVTGGSGSAAATPSNSNEMCEAEPSSASSSPVQSTSSSGSGSSIIVQHQHQQKMNVQQQLPAQQSTTTTTSTTQSQLHMHLTRPVTTVTNHNNNSNNISANNLSNNNSGNSRLQTQSPTTQQQHQHYQSSSSSSLLSSTHSVLAKSLMEEPRMTPEQMKRQDIIQNYIKRESAATGVASANNNHRRSPAVATASSPSNTLSSIIVANGGGGGSNSSAGGCPFAAKMRGNQSPSRYSASVITTTTRSPTPTAMEQQHHHSLHNGRYFQSPHSTSSPPVVGTTTASASASPAPSMGSAASPRLVELQVDIADAQQPLNLSKKSPSPSPIPSITITARNAGGAMSPGPGVVVQGATSSGGSSAAAVMVVTAGPAAAAAAAAANSSKVLLEA